MRPMYVCLSVALWWSLDKLHSMCALHGTYIHSSTLYHINGAAAYCICRQFVRFGYMYRYLWLLRFVQYLPRKWPRQFRIRMDARTLFNWQLENKEKCSRTRTNTHTITSRSTARGQFNSIPLLIAIFFVAIFGALKRNQIRFTQTNKWPWQSSDTLFLPKCEFTGDEMRKKKKGNETERFSSHDRVLRFATVADSFIGFACRTLNSTDRKINAFIVQVQVPSRIAPA